MIPPIRRRNSRSTEAQLYRSATINVLDNSNTAKIEGTLTEAQWTGVATKIETAINAEWEKADRETGRALGDTFANNDVVITVVKNAGYKYKVINKKHLSLDLDSIDTVDFTAAIKEMYNWQITPRTLTFGTAENPCTVTIKSDDQFTAAEWKTLCDKVVAAIERGYNKKFEMDFINKPLFEGIFKNRDMFIVLLKSATYDIEIKTAGDTTIS